MDDAVAFRVTTAFYEALATGHDVATSLALARRACRNDPTTAAPRHWAAFVLVGDGDIALPLQDRQARWPWAVVLAVAALGAGWFYRR